jgi:predicted DNA binding CopG/RHH family protein
MSKSKAVALTALEKRMADDSNWKSVDGARLEAVKKDIEGIRDDLKQERVNARFSTADIEALKHRAAAEGVPYQTLLGSIVHKYVTGQLVDINTAKMALEAMLKKHG